MFTQIIKIVLLAAVSLLVYACGPSDSDQQNQLRDEVMAVHDEVMPKMDDIHNLQKALMAQAAGLKADTLNPDADALQMIEQTIGKLKDADEAMMQWMRDFEPVQGDKSHEAYMEYLREQKRAIEEVRSQMNQSIEEAESLVK